MHHTATAVAITLALFYVAVNRARGESSPSRARRSSKGSRESEGFVDLIREETDLLRKLEQEVFQPSLSRTQLAAGRLVVVIIGPSSTAVHQSYVVNKLLRYLRWSNLVRRHFRMSDQDPAALEEPSSDSTNDLTDSEESCGSDREKPCPHTHARAHAVPGNLGASAATQGLHGSSLANGNGHGRSSGEKNGYAANGGSKTGTPGGTRQTDRYTFSDRGKAAALTTIAVQESAKKVSTWLNGLKAGGVAVVETGRSGWASTRHGREALPGFLRQTTGPDLGILWVELLPSGLYHRAEPPPPPPPPRQQQQQQQQQPPSTRVSSARSSASASASASAGGDGGKGGGAWKSANGLSRGVPKTPGGNVVETFLQSGNLVGAGGSVIYESTRRGARRDKGGRKDKGCYVSLADQGLDVQSQLEDDACPLVRRVGTFAAALRMKKSWHGCPVYLTRHGESLGNQSKSMGGDLPLSQKGNKYASVLADFVEAQPDAGQSRLLVWCSPMRRAAQTARAVKCHRYTEWQALTELDTGIFNGCSYKEAEREYPEEFAAREMDKLCYRYPEGEGYLDVVNRLDPVIVALEREDRPVMVISHQAVLRCLYAYFHDMSLREMPRVPISLHTVVKLTPIDYHPEVSAPRFWKELRFELIKQTTLEHLAEVATINGGKGRRASQLGESLA
eukprot:g7473.t1